MGATGASRLLGGPRGLRPRWGAASTRGPPIRLGAAGTGVTRGGATTGGLRHRAQLLLLAHGARRGVDPGRHPRVRP